MKVILVVVMLLSLVSSASADCSWRLWSDY